MVYWESIQLLFSNWEKQSSIKVINVGLTLTYQHLMLKKSQYIFFNLSTPSSLLISYSKNWVTSSQPISQQQIKNSYLNTAKSSEFLRQESPSCQVLLKLDFDLWIISPSFLYDLYEMYLILYMMLFSLSKKLTFQAKNSDSMKFSVISTEQSLRVQLIISSKVMVNLNYLSISDLNRSIISLSAALLLNSASSLFKSYRQNFLAFIQALDIPYNIYINLLYPIDSNIPYTYIIITTQNRLSFILYNQPNILPVKMIPSVRLSPLYLIQLLLILNLMFKYLILYAFVAVLVVQCTIQVYTPSCAAEKFSNKSIVYTLSNFGYIPYGQVILGQIILPANESLCSVQGETYIRNKDHSTQTILLVKRGSCKFTQKVINAQKLGADLVIIYDENPSDVPNVIMKNDGHGHLAEIPSMFISNSDGIKLRTSSKDCELPSLKIEFQLQQRQKSQVVLWLDASNRQTYILTREFYKNDYYKIIADKIHLSIRFRVQTTCGGLFCSADDCIGKVLGPKFCRNVDKQINKNAKGTAIILQQLREHFLWQSLQKSNSDRLLWWRYMHKFDHKICIQTLDIEDCSLTAMAQVQIPQNIIQQVKGSIAKTLKEVDNGQNSILTLNSLEAKQLGIYFYPEATINNKNYYGLFKAPEVFQMICQSLISPPKECITFIKNNHHVYNKEDDPGVWKTILLTLLIMTIGFIIALLLYTKMIRRQVDTQLSLQVNKMVQNYVDLAQTKKSTGNSYSKFEQA